MNTENSTSVVKKVLIAITILIALTVSYKIGVRDGSRQHVQNPASQEPKLPERKKSWTEVYTFKGNGMKKSPSFELTGGETRIRYEYSGEKGLGMGAFAAYVIEEGNDIYKTGGFPEVFTQAEKESSESAMQKRRGRYYLNIDAMGNWVVIVEEFK
jgi:hypothetical protein